jgi:hypothetical protein
MSGAIGTLLTRFDANGRTRPAEKPKVTAAAAKPKEIKRETVAAPRAETQAELPDEAYRRGYRAGLSEADAKLAEERVRGAIRLGEERAKWSDQHAVAIVNGLAAACRDLEMNIASSVARILELFVSEAVRKKAVEVLVEQISALTCNSSVPVFRISGPGDLLELVKAKLGTAQRMDIEYEVADGVEVRVVADQAVIETHIAMWIERLKGARRQSQ